MKLLEYMSYVAMFSCSCYVPGCWLIMERIIRILFWDKLFKAMLKQPTGLKIKTDARICEKSRVEHFLIDLRLIETAWMSITALTSWGLNFQALHGFWRNNAAFYYMNKIDRNISLIPTGNEQDHLSFSKLRSPSNFWVIHVTSCLLCYNLRNEQLIPFVMIIILFLK